LRLDTRTPKADPFERDRSTFAQGNGYNRQNLAKNIQVKLLKDSEEQSECIEDVLDEYHLSNIHPDNFTN
jgi:hypothetical protein